MSKKTKNPRIIKKKCPYCGHDKAFVSRSDLGLGAYVYKCSKCKRYLK